MKVSLDISDAYREPYAVIYTDKVTDEIQHMIDLLGSGASPITALKNEEDLIVLSPDEIHMGIGCTIYTIVAYSVGWIGASASPAMGILIAAVQLLIAFLIWFLFMRYYRSEAKRLNERIQEMK